MAAIMHTYDTTSSYSWPEEAPITGAIGVADAATFQEYHPLVRAAIPPQKEACSGVVIAESTGVAG